MDIYFWKHVSRIKSDRGTSWNRLFIIIYLPFLSDISTSSTSRSEEVLNTWNWSWQESKYPNLDLSSVFNENCSCSHQNFCEQLGVKMICISRVNLIIPQPHFGSQKILQGKLHFFRSIDIKFKYLVTYTQNVTSDNQAISIKCWINSGLPFVSLINFDSTFCP